MICQGCIEQDGRKVGNLEIGYLCAACEQEAPNSYLLRKNDNTFLIVAEDAAELVSIEVTKDDENTKMTQYNLLENLITDDTV